jgi:hypothetical protein
VRPGARRQDQRRAPRRGPPAVRARLRGAQPGEGGALDTLHRRPHRQRLHHRSQDRSSQDARSYPEEAILGLMLKSFFYPSHSVFSSFSLSIKMGMMPGKSVPHFLAYAFLTALNFHTNE